MPLLVDYWATFLVSKVAKQGDWRITWCHAGVTIDSRQWDRDHCSYVTDHQNESMVLFNKNWTSVWFALRTYYASRIFIFFEYVEWIFSSVKYRFILRWNLEIVASSFSSPFFLRVFLKNLDKRWSSSDAGWLSVLSFVIPLASM